VKTSCGHQAKYNHGGHGGHGEEPRTNGGEWRGSHDAPQHNRTNPRNNSIVLVRRPSSFVLGKPVWEDDRGRRTEDGMADRSSQFANRGGQLSSFVRRPRDEEANSIAITDRARNGRMAGFSRRPATIPNQTPQHFNRPRPSSVVLRPRETSVGRRRGRRTEDGIADRSSQFADRGGNCRPSSFVLVKPVWEDAEDGGQQTESQIGVRSSVIGVGNCRPSSFVLVTKKWDCG